MSFFMLKYLLKESFMTTQNWLYDIETLRIERKINQESFLKDIVSDRQYRRYLNGESTLTLTIFLKLLERLDYTLPTFLTYLETKKTKEHQQFEQLRFAMIDFDYSTSKTMIKDIQSKHLSKEQLETLKLYETLIEFYEKLGQNEHLDKTRVDNILKETNVLSLLNYTYYSSSTFSLINLLMNKIFNVLDQEKQQRFLRFYLDFIENRKFVLDGDTLENKQMVYSYYVSAIYGRPHISEEETKKGGQLIKDAILLTKETLMSYNLMALNYLNSSMCYLHQLNDDAKKSLFYTFMSVFGTGNPEGIFPSFKLAFSQVTTSQVLLKDFKDELLRHLKTDTYYQEEVLSYNDLSTCAG